MDKVNLFVKDGSESLYVKQILFRIGMPKVKVIGSKKRAWFNPWTNTMNVHNRRSFISEMTHAYQMYSCGFWCFIVRIIRDWIRDPYITSDGQSRQYSMVGSLEFEAHEVIFPVLLDAIENGPEIFYKWMNSKN